MNSVSESSTSLAAVRSTARSSAEIRRLIRSSFAIAIIVLTLYDIKDPPFACTAEASLIPNA